MMFSSVPTSQVSANIPWSSTDSAIFISKNLFDSSYTLFLLLGFDLGRALLLHSILLLFLFDYYWRHLQYFLFSSPLTPSRIHALVEYWCYYSYLYWVLGLLFLSGISVGDGVATARANIHGGNQWYCCSLYYFDVTIYDVQSDNTTIFHLKISVWRFHSKIPFLLKITSSVAT